MTTVTRDQRLRHIVSAAIITVVMLAANLAFSLQDSAEAGVCRYQTPSFCIEEPRPMVAIAGIVNDVYGDPVGQAEVVDGSGTGNRTTTDSNGAYAISVYGDTLGFYLWAHKDGMFDWDAIFISDPLVASTSSQDFALPYLLNTSVSPGAFNSLPRALSFEALTTAPVLGTKVRVEINGAAVTLQYSPTPTDPPGYQRWTGIYTVSDGTADGTYYFNSCALKDQSGGGCESEVDRLTLIKSASYILDRASPVFSTSSPSPFADVFSLSQVSASWQDPLAGVDTSSLRMWVEGVTQTAVSASGGTLIASVSPTPGIHFVEIEAKDRAGNTARSHFLFTRLSLSATEESATLLGKTVQVNPSNSIPPPSTVRIPAPRVEFNETTLNLNASTRVGKASLSRPYALGQVEVVFTNETGMTSSVTKALPSYSDTSSLGVLSPSTGTMQAVVPAHSGTIPDIVVDVPTGFSTSGSTAVLIEKTVVMGGHTIPGGEFFKDKWPTSVPVNGAIGRCFSGTGSSVVVQCRTGEKAGVQPYVQGGPTIDRLFVPLDQQAEPNDGKNFDQAPDCFGCSGEGSRDPFIGAELRATFALACPSYTPDTRTGLSTINLCSGVPNTPTTSAWSAFLNSWVYQDSQLGRFPVWQQDRAISGEASCPNGGTGNFRGRTYRLVANLKANDGANAPIIGGTEFDATDPAGLQYVYLGKKTGNKTGANDRTEPKPVFFQLSNEAPADGSYQPAVLSPTGVVGSTQFPWTPV